MKLILKKYDLIIYFKSQSSNFSNLQLSSLTQEFDCWNLIGFFIRQMAFIHWMPSRISWSYHHWKKIFSLSICIRDWIEKSGFLEKESFETRNFGSVKGWYLGNLVYHSLMTFKESMTKINNWVKSWSE